MKIIYLHRLLRSPAGIDKRAYIEEVLFKHYPVNFARKKWHWEWTMNILLDPIVPKTLFINTNVPSGVFRIIRRQAFFFNFNTENILVSVGIPSLMNRDCNNPFMNGSCSSSNCSTAIIPPSMIPMKDWMEKWPNLMRSLKLDWMMSWTN